MSAYKPLHAFTVPRQLPELEAAGPQLTPAAQFFRRAIAAVLRKRSAPAVLPSAGAATALLSDPDEQLRIARELRPGDAEPVLGNGTIAEAKARWDARQAEDVAVTGHPETAPAGFPATAPAQQGAVPVNGPLPRRIPGASVREHGSWT